MRRLAVRLALVLVLTFAAAVTVVPASADLAASRVAPAGTARYIVQLADAPLATYTGGIAGLPATSPAAESPGDVAVDGAGADLFPGGGSGRLDTTSPAAIGYTRYLDARQSDFAAALPSVAPGARPLYHYHVAFNGVTVRLSETEAASVARLPGVVAVTREEPIEVRMDASLPQIAAGEAWADPRVGGRSGAGRGVRIAILDTGISATHPMFDDAGFTPPAGFPRGSVTVGDTVTPFTTADLAAYTNAKVIVARIYANPEVVQPGQPLTPLATVFHGAHVAGIAAGSPVTAPSPDGSTVEVSGVAPGAYVMAYKMQDAYTPEILRMIDDAVADGADVMNNSWGAAAMHVSDPEHHPLSEAFKAAAAAGVVVVAAAGNAGTNGEATLGGPFQMLDEVITVANVQTGRRLEEVVLAADTGLTETLRVHPAQNFALGNTYDVLEGQALVSDLCDTAAAFQARDKVVLLRHDAACEGSMISLPIQLPEQAQFVQSLLVAGFVGARAVVVYAPTDETTALTRVYMSFAEMIQMVLGAQFPQFKFPVTAVIGGERAMELVAWAEGHRSLRLTVNRNPVSIPAPELADVAADSSARGPAPDGATTPLKPDIAAPGTNVRSANTSTDGGQNGLIAASGTSMASPHVAGAAAVVRQVHPTWTPAQIKAALLTTADPVVTDAGEVASAMVQGAGRLNLARAIDPGVLVAPPSLDLGVRRPAAAGADVVLVVRDVREDAAGPAVWQVRHEPGPGNDDFAPTLPDEVTVPAGGDARIDVAFPAVTQPPGTYDGRIVLERDGRVVRVTYAVHVPDEQTDVLLVNVLRTARTIAGVPIPQLVDTPDYAAYWTRALDEARLEHDVWTIGQGGHGGLPPLSTLQAYDLVVVAAGDGTAPLELTNQGMTALQMYLLGGGRLLAAGHAWDHGPASLYAFASAQGSGLTYYLSRYFAGFERTVDDTAVTEALVPVRLFGAPIRLSATTSDDAAGNGGTIDLGRPLAALSTTSATDPTGQPIPPLDLGMAAPVAVERLMPYMRTYLEAPGRGSAMTGVTADATLEVPERAEFISWRALFAGFAIEAVTAAEGTLSRAELLGRVHAWAVEPDDFTPSIGGPDGARAGQPLAVTAAGESPSGVRAVAWRWDAGDGRPYVSTTGPSTSLSYPQVGSYTVRAEATTADGHTYVASKVVRVGGIYLPAAYAGAR